MPTTIVWFRNDLRVRDNPALREASERGAVVPVYIVDDEAAGPWAPGGAARWWRGLSLETLDHELRTLGSKLLIMDGPAGDALLALAAATEADGVVWNRRYDAASIDQDSAVKATLKERGFKAWSCNGSLLFEPWEVRNGQGEAYKVFTHFAKSCLKTTPIREPVDAPARLIEPKVSWTVEQQSTKPVRETASWTVGLAASWQPGETNAVNKLAKFLEDKAEDYGDNRDRPGHDGTSRMSPHLRWGELSPSQIWHATVCPQLGGTFDELGSGPQTFLKELLWREFGYHILYHVADLPTAPLKPAFAQFPWNDDRSMRNAWRFGRTGVPLVDAGMRQLRETGWMHNRVRMVVGSFLVKDLLQHWLHGARWFWDNLVDADLASNTLGWQWVAGTGPDAAPYFRIFNPVRQGERFDPDGAYVRRWVPELERMPASHIHAPATAPASVLAAAGVELGRSYPAPVVEHKQARKRALDALATIKQSA